MQTISGQQIMRAAAAAAARNPDDLTAEEGGLLRIFITHTFEYAWTYCPWPDWTHVGEFVPSPAGQVLKTGMDRVHGVWNADFRVTSYARKLNVHEEADVISLLPPNHKRTQSVWIEYSEPCLDLLLLSDDAFATFAFPRVFGRVLAMSAAGNLRRSDGKLESGDELIAMANKDLEEAALFVWQARTRSPVASYRPLASQHIGQNSVLEIPEATVAADQTMRVVGSDGQSYEVKVTVINGVPTLSPVAV